MTKKKIKIAIVEDDQFYSKLLVKYLRTICNPKYYSNFSFEFLTFSNAEDAIQNLDDDIKIMLLDYYLFDENNHDQLNGGHVLEMVNKYCPDCRVIVMSGQHNISITAKLFKEGIYDYVDKNTSSNDRIGALVKECLHHETE